jgi:hypothetical protein
MESPAIPGRFTRQGLAIYRRYLDIVCDHKSTSLTRYLDDVIVQVCPLSKHDMITSYFRFQWNRHGRRPIDSVHDREVGNLASNHRDFYLAADVNGLLDGKGFER